MGGEVYQQVIKRIPALKAGKESASTTGAGKLFQDGLVLIKKECLYGLTEALRA